MAITNHQSYTPIKIPIRNPNPKSPVLVVISSSSTTPGTVAVAGGGFIAQSKRLRGVDLVEISVQNRDAQTEAVAKRFEAAEDAGWVW